MTPALEQRFIQDCYMGLEQADILIYQLRDDPRFQQLDVEEQDIILTAHMVLSMAKNSLAHSLPRV